MLLLGFYAILVGISQVGLGLRPRSLRENLGGATRTMASSMRRAEWPVLAGVLNGDAVLFDCAQGQQSRALG